MISPVLYWIFGWAKDAWRFIGRCHFLWRVDGHLPIKCKGEAWDNAKKKCLKKGVDIQGKKYYKGSEHNKAQW